MNYEYGQYSRAMNDFYIDPPFCSEKLFQRVKFEGLIHDPACGSGNIIRSARKLGYYTTYSDLIDRGFANTFIKNFFDDKEEYDNIVTNPPYNLTEQFIHKSFSCTRNKVAILTRLAFLEGQKRNKTLFSKYPPMLVLVFSTRPSMPPAGVKEGGGKTAYCWIIWDKHIGQTGLDWLL